MAFHLLRWTYFNDVIVGRNISMNFQFERILFMSSDKKMKQNWERQGKKMEKESNTDESDFSENEISDLNYLKPLEFEPKINIIPK